MIAGPVGILLGATLAQRLRSKFPRVDPLICAVVVIIISQFIFATSLLSPLNDALCYTATFFAQLFLNLYWSMVANMLQVRTHRMFFICFGVDLRISCAKYIMNCSVCVC
jgi:hypothetical protein